MALIVSGASPGACPTSPKHTRGSGVEVSDIRAGRRPHTRVFTAKSHTAGVPTLVIGGDPLQS
jgi:hypothetical protein